MKAIIFAGIGLFAAATIYGITDFAADKKKGTLDKLYKEEPAASAAEEKVATAVTVEKTTVPSGVAVNSKSTLKKTTAGKKPKKLKAEAPRFIKLDDFSRGRIVPKVVKTEASAAPSAELKKEDE